MEYKTLVTEFAAGLGVSEIPFDEDGVACLQADDMILSFMEIPERASVLTWAKVATPPPEKLEELYKLMLEASFMGRATQGATFSLENGAIYLHRVDALVNLDIESFFKIVEDFLNLVEKWRGIIEAFRADTSTLSGEGSEEPEFGSLSFTRV